MVVVVVVGGGDTSSRKNVCIRRETRESFTGRRPELSTVAVVPVPA